MLVALGVDAREDRALELVRRGLARSRGQARDLVERGLVRVDGTAARKASHPVEPGSDLVVELAGPGSLASGAGDDSGVPGWARVATPAYLNLRKASIYGGSNESQRQIIARTILGL